MQQYYTEEVKRMRAAEIREELAAYIVAVQPRTYMELLTDKLLIAIEHKSADISQAMKVFMAAELRVAHETGDYRIRDMIQKLRQVDRHVTKGKVRT